MIAEEIPATRDTVIINGVSFRFDAVPIKEPIIAADMSPIDSFRDSNF